MKTISLMIFLFTFNYYINSQVPEWMTIDLQELIMYDAIANIFDIDLTKQEILEITKGEYGAIWFTTQDYKIKYLPNNLLVYSKYNLNNPLYFLFYNTFASEYYSRINKKDIANKYPANTWVKYNDPNSYEYAMWTDEEKSRKEYLNLYQIDNYQLTFENEKQISLEEVYGHILFNYPDLYFQLNKGAFVNLVGGRITEKEEKLHLGEIFKSKTFSERIFDIDADVCGNIWIATGKRLIRFDGNNFFEIDIPAVALENDLKNNLWIGTAAYNAFGSIIKFDGTTFTIFNSYNSPLPDNTGIHDLYIDKHNNLWITLKRTGLPYKLDNIKLAVFNQSGLESNCTSGLVSNITTVKKRLIENQPYLSFYKILINYNVEKSLLSGRIEFLIDNNPIYDFIVEEDHCKNSLSFTYDIYKSGKYPFTVLFIDSSGERNEIMQVDLELRFNDYGYFLGQNEPNPFSKYTRIEYGFFQGYMVELKIFDSFLRQLDKFTDYYIDWIGKPYLFETKEFPNGVYSYYIKENFAGILDYKKMILFNPEKIISLPH